ncbi:MAG: phosphate ABC transporter ATP-binding protein [Lachnospiraceae bacterium]|nr:phosphate ABC transporter ATP-binding protein [Lachnospiraceae bacterium]
MGKDIGKNTGKNILESTDVKASAENSAAYSLSLDNVSAFYREYQALDGISLDIPRHRITSIIGPSGCGKSTLLKCMNRLLEETAGGKITGRILLEGKDTEKYQADQLCREVGMVSQTPAPFPFSVYRNLTYAPRYYGIRKKAQLNQIVEETLKLADLYEELLGNIHKNALELSGGQQQRLCIARALTAKPSVLLLDEPCSALDVRSTSNIERLLLKLKKDYTIVIVTHNIFQAKRISDHVVFMNQGRIIETGTAAELFEHPQKNETKDFLEGVFG